MSVLLDVIRAKCLDCVCDERSEIEKCNITRCPLHEFRMGVNPRRKKREYSEEEKEKIANRLKNGRTK